MRCPYGFRILGGCYGERRLVKWQAAFTGHCAADPVSNPEQESYLSAFTFGDDFRTLLDSTRSTAGFTGSTWAAWLWFDIDRDGDLPGALDAARRLAAFTADRFGLDDDLLAFLSGGKGFHLGLPTGLFTPDPSCLFHRCCRALAQRLAAEIVVPIDTGVYDRVRAFRSPNSRHPKTGLHKRRLTLDELLHIDAAGIVRLAAEPLAFDVPPQPGSHPQAIADWADAVSEVERADRATAQQREAKGAAGGPVKLNRSTLDFLREGTTAPDRHRLLFSAAADLAEHGCGYELAAALLTEAALDCGLPPRDVVRQIQCGFDHATRGNTP